jgi:hypothetical protein
MYRRHRYIELHRGRRVSVGRWWEKGQLPRSIDRSLEEGVEYRRKWSERRREEGPRQWDLSRGHFVILMCG